MSSIVSLVLQPRYPAAVVAAAGGLLLPEQPWQMLAGGMSHEVGQLCHLDHTPCNVCLYAYIVASVQPMHVTLVTSNSRGAWMRPGLQPICLVTKIRLL